MVLLFLAIVQHLLPETQKVPDQNQIKIRNSSTSHFFIFVLEEVPGPDSKSL
jgi:hypothetical protein